MKEDCPVSILEEGLGIISLPDGTYMWGSSRWHPSLISWQSLWREAFRWHKQTTWAQTKDSSPECKLSGLVSALGKWRKRMMTISYQYLLTWISPICSIKLVIYISVLHNFLIMYFDFFQLISPQWLMCKIFSNILSHILHKILTQVTMVCGEFTLKLFSSVSNANTNV